MKSEFLIVARKLMETERRPLSPRELVDLGLKRQLFSDKIAGRTPHQTMKAKLSVHIRRFVEKSPFVRTAPGRFYLRHLVNGKSETFQAKPIIPPPSHEHVLVYRANELDKLTTWQGLKTSWKEISRMMFSQLSVDYCRRLDVEENNDYTQILTYVLVTRGDAILAYRRGTYNRTERYLRGSYCVGFGGHVTEADLNLFNAQTKGVLECASRELMEELHIPLPDIERLHDREGLDIIGIISVCQKTPLSELSCHDPPHFPRQLQPNFVQEDASDRSGWGDWWWTGPDLRDAAIGRRSRLLGSGFKG